MRRYLVVWRIYHFSYFFNFYDSYYSRHFFMESNLLVSLETLLFLSRQEEYYRAEELLPLHWFLFLLNLTLTDNSTLGEGSNTMYSLCHCKSTRLRKKPYRYLWTSGTLLRLRCRKDTLILCNEIAPSGVLYLSILLR